MKVRSVLNGIIATSLLTVAAQSAPAALVLRYDTWPAVGNSVTNTGTSATAGTLIGNTGGTTFPAGPDTLLSAHFNDGVGGNNNLGTGINTNKTLSSLSGGDSSFTAAAWVNLDDTNGDNMVFGTNGGNPMHLGFRGNSAYFGFWGNDSNSAGIATAGTWNYWTWRWNGANGTQDIFENGALVSSSGGHGNPFQGGENLTIGTNGGNSGDLNGGVDDVRFYNTALSNDAVVSDFRGALGTDIPEPATLGLAGIGLFGAFARRRKA